MATSIGAGPSHEPVLAQSLIEKAFPQGMTACTERVRFARAEQGREPTDGGFAMKPGILTGALAEHELRQFAASGAFTLDLGQVVDRILASTRLGRFPSARVAELRTAALTLVRQYQASFPPVDQGLDWSEVTYLLEPQTDLFLWRRGCFKIRVRPDIIVGVGETLMAVEFSTAKDPAAVGEARVGLNHHALELARKVRPEWSRFQRVATRIEMLTLDEGRTMILGDEEAKCWREAIGKAAEALAESRYAKNVGPHCSTCPWQVPCWFDENQHSDNF